jgi:RNA polymerase sigma-70 factor (ECF subfamily)
LVLRCQSGDEAAFVKLYNHFYDRTLRYLKGLVNEQDALDLHQDIWSTVFQKIASLSNPNALRTWLYQTTRNRAIDYLRRKKRYLDVLQEIASEIDERAPDFEDERWLSVESKRLNRAMGMLPVAHRDVLMLRFWEDMSYTEIALIVGCSVGTVRSRLHHAKLNVKNRLAKMKDLPS